MIARVTIPVEVPAEAIALSHVSPEQLRGDLVTLLILDQVRQGHISTGKAAELLGIPMVSMMDLMAAHQIPYPNYSVEDLRREFGL